MFSLTLSVDYHSPVGIIRVHFAEGFITRVELKTHPIKEPSPKPDGLPRSIKRYLDSYFLKKPTPIKPQWFKAPQSTFAKKIYRTLQTVRFGTQISYGDLAKKTGYSAHYARAVGQAMHKNPWPLFVPCHRVISGNGDFGGFSADESIKEALLTHEGFQVSTTLPFKSERMPLDRKISDVS
jgi:methylated-DNA-[protein]-cysteine S-methyltransferase